MIKTGLQLDKERYTPADQKLIASAHKLAAAAHKGQSRLGGDPFIVHPESVAQYLVDLGLDADAVAAALLHDTVEDTDLELPDIKRQFGQTVADLVDGVTKVGEVELRSAEADMVRTKLSSENTRKLLLAMTKDIRVILIKLADRLHNLKTMDALPEATARRLSEENLEIYAPLADRLGMGELKGELEDLSFRYLYPKEYKEIESKLAQVTKQTSRYLARLKRFITEELSLQGVGVISVDGRRKHIYSIYKKLSKVGSEDLSEIYDLIAVRVIVPSVPDCYKTLGILHQHFKPLIHRIKDYIAVPKPNGYRSLHTTVFALDGRITEIQIRTTEMHELAEKGLAAHFFYDEFKQSKAYRAGRHTGKVPKQLEWVAKLTDVQKASSSSQELVEALKLDLFEDRIFIFSPKGDLYDLPEGTTPVDFAFAVHTDIGLRTAGAKVNGRIVPLDSRLENRDVVEIQTKKEPSPSRDWLGFVKTASARNRIRAFLRSQNRSSHIDQGKALVEQSLKAWGLKRVEEIPKRKIDDLLEALPYKSLEDVLAAVGEGAIAGVTVMRKLFPPPDAATSRPKAKVIAKAPSGSTGKIIISQMTDLSYTLAPCCKPAYPAPIVGYITRGSGATIHRRGCANLPDAETDRLVTCHWELKGERIKVRLKVMADNSLGLLSDITGTVAGLGINITGIKSKNRKQSQAEIGLDIEVADLYILAALIKKLERVPQVSGVYRVK